ncbi:hypothetical protein RhiJN_27040 [Ceratobasidium sp. AG-Ba]|nr:hypothetical protein RhiJN_27040 [Ceratobasidium sp. AG-Ba]
MPDYDELLSYSESHTLLPNLQTITWGSGYPNPLHYQAVAIRLGLFLSPSLLEFRIANDIDQALWRPSIAWLVLSSIVDTCPDIRVLDLFPDHNATDSETEPDESCEDVSALLRAEAPDPTFRDLGPLFGELQNLTELRTNIGAIESFPLEGLANLKFLEVNMHWDSHNTRLPYELFPSLEHLGLLCCYQTDLSLLLPSHNTQISSLRFHEYTVKSLERQVVSHIVKSLPELATVSIYSDTQRAWESDVAEVPPDFLEPLGTLTKMRHLDLIEITVSSMGGSAVETLSWLGPRLLDIQVLRMRRQEVALLQLPNLVSQLPKLEYLELDIVDLDAVGAPDSSLTPCSLRLQCLEFNLLKELTAMSQSGRLNTARLDDIAQ